MAPFRDRVALVTGAGSGIGAALAGVIAGVARNRVVPGLPPHARLLRWRSRVQRAPRPPRGRWLAARFRARHGTAG